MSRAVAALSEAWVMLADSSSIADARLAAAAPAQAGNSVPGLSARAAFWAGLALCTPTLLFVVTNAGFYGFGLAWMEPALPERLFGPVVDNIIVMLEGVVLRWRPAHLAVAAMAGGLFTVVAIVVLRERLYQMIGG